MEAVYVMTGKQVYKDMTQFWGKLFGINFAMGVATGLTLEFQFGTNWSYYSHYVGDIFGVPLAVEGLMAFFLESTIFGLFFFGWNRLSRVQHLIVTFLVALGSNLSALWILVANGWMNNPVGTELNYEAMRMELTSFFQVVFNPVAQMKFVHTVSAGYVTASMFVLGISSWYLLKKRDTQFALRSFAIAAGFGLASTRSVIVLGDESGYNTGEVQKIQEGDTTDATRATFAKYKDDLGFGLMLKQFTAKVTDATPDQIQAAAKKKIAPVAPVFFSFRIMVALGILFLAAFVAAFRFCARRTLLQENKLWFLRWAVWAIPLPWIVAEFGWVVAELGRQPWAIAGILPTRLSAGDLYLSVAGFVVFYKALFIVEITLMFKYARLGPSSLHTGRYHHELGERDRAALSGRKTT
ncbi:Cytochrome bd-I ubiquinol oxidase subunit 1 [Paraburkholderia nemoris]|nr:Cytochrome bd-I ubiquinol oxidase subunit 1 [Paraburkholderia nemoris]